MPCWSSWTVSAVPELVGSAVPELVRRAVPKLWRWARRGPVGSAVLCWSLQAVLCGAKAPEPGKEGPSRWLCCAKAHGQCCAVPELCRWTRRGPVSSAVLCQNSAAVQGEILCVAVLYRGSRAMPCSTEAPEPDKETLNSQRRAKAHSSPVVALGEPPDSQTSSAAQFHTSYAQLFSKGEVPLSVAASHPKSSASHCYEQRTLQLGCSLGRNRGTEL